MVETLMVTLRGLRPPWNYMLMLNFVRIHILAKGFMAVNQNLEVICAHNSLRKLFWVVIVS